MPTTLRDSDEAKRKLEAIKRDDETFEELLDRLASQVRTMEPGAWVGTEKAALARSARERTRTSFE